MTTVRDTANAARLWEEYKLLQDKVDKIGAFRFTVKAWVVPSLGAFIAALYGAKIPSVFALLGLLFVAAFYFLEKQQHAHQRAFIHRLRVIESFLKRPHPSGEPQAFGPITHASKRTQPRTPIEAIEIMNRSLERSRDPVDWIVSRANEVFYFLATAFVVVFAFCAPDPSPAATSGPTGSLERAVDAGRP
jgi:hypothetical protein